MRKALALALLGIIAVSSLGFAVASASAMGPSNRGWGWGMGYWRKNGDAIPFQRSWVRVNGIVETWKTPVDDVQTVKGALSVNARTVNSTENIRKVAFATAIWSNTTNSREKGNFSYSFYSARLIDANVSIPNFNADTDYFLNGTWAVVNVTITQTVIKTGDAENGYTINRQTNTDVVPLPKLSGYGELNVTKNWTEFKLTIEKTNILSGTIGKTRMTQMTFNEFKVSEDETERVSRVDLKIMAKNFGARPGWGAYDSNMDFNCNYKIDIADLSTVAANVGST